MSSELPDPIADVLDDTADEARVQRLWRGIEARQGRARRSRGPAITAVVLAAAAALLWIAWPTESDGAGPLRLASGAPFEALDGAREVRLEDGSRVVLDDGARIEPLRNDASAVTLLLARGRARFEIEPGGPRTWSVESGVATVEVVGTVFVVERGDGWARVEVERGVVMVRGERVPDRAARLARGHAITVGDREAQAHVEPAPADTREEIAPPREPSPRRTERAPRPSETTEPSEPSEATDGIAAPEATRPAVDAEALMAQADDARRAGRTEDAAALLERAMALEEDASAGVAAFTLGRLELDVRRRPARAARAFGRALALPLPPHLREDARARLVEAHARAGDEDAARRAAGEYLAAHPSGRHAARVRALLEPTD